MGLFDNLKNSVNETSKPAAAGGNRVVDVVFPTLPDDLSGFMALPQAALANPFDTAAMTVLALCFYPQDQQASLAMLDYLRGPRPLSNYDKQFIADRFRGADYLARSYFKGATYRNDYVPSEPYTVTVNENPHSYTNENYARLFLTSGGADSQRYIDLRLAKDGKWYLWEQYILSQIRAPESSNPWA